MSLITISAEGSRVVLNPVRGVEFVFEFFEEDDTTNLPISLAGSTPYFRTRAGSVEEPSATSVDLSSKISLLGTSDLGANVVLRISLTAAEVNANFAADQPYCYSAGVTPSGGQPREMLRGPVVVSEQI